MRHSMVTTILAALVMIAAVVNDAPAEIAPGESLFGRLTAEELARRFAVRRPTLGGFRLSQRLFDAVNLGTSYKYALEIGEKGFVRIDEFVCTSECTPIEIGAEVTFVRVFDSALEAAAAPPPQLSALPTTAAKALAMHDGDVVAVPTRADVVARATTTLLDLVPGIRFEGEVRCVASGAYDLQIIRGSRRYVHLRVLQRTQVEGGAALAVATGFELFGHDVGAAVRLSHEACTGIQIMAHYCIDLGSEAARVAYERALSGGGLPRRPDAFVHDLTLLDELADESVANDDLAVRRVSAAVDRWTGRRQSLFFHAARFKAGFEREWCRNSLTIRSGPAAGERHFLAALYKSRKNLAGLCEGFFERSSGVLLHATAAGEARSVGPHWFCWNRRSPPWHSFVPSSTIDEFANLLGPLATRIDFDRLLRPDRRQRWQCLQIVASSRAMEALFDENLTTPAVVGRALANMVRTMDVQFMLPYNQLPFRLGTTGNEETCPSLDEALAAMAHSWGRWYAGYFRECFVPRLLAVQRSDDVTARMAFLADVYDAGLGANDFGGAMLSRFIIEVLDVLGLAESEIYGAVTMTYHVPADRTEDPTVRATLGTFEDRAVLDTLWRMTSTHMFEY